MGVARGRELGSLFRRLNNIRSECGSHRLRLGRNHPRPCPFLPRILPLRHLCEDLMIYILELSPDLLNFHHFGLLAHLLNMLLCDPMQVLLVLLHRFFTVKHLSKFFALPQLDGYLLQFWL